jgi:exonuclease 1
MQHFGVTPYLVFDGGYLPSKAGEEAHRRQRRQESQRAGMELLRAGKPSLAHKELQKAVNITPEMARNLIEELKKLSLPYVVAPYEADAQMVYLERHGFVGGIVSEDSDLLVFGARRLLTKLDDQGQCIEINRRDFAACRDLHMVDWTDAQFRHMAIFRGCDYSSGIKDFGLKTAYRMLRKYKTPERVVKRIQLEGKLRLPADYLQEFRQAELTFLYQRVYCPKAQQQVFLTPLPEDLNVDDMPFIGAAVDPATAHAIAMGDIDPITKRPIVLPLSPESRKRRASSTIPTGQSVSHPPKRPIESYFRKDTRIPLGNMDPNCFTIAAERRGSAAEDEQRPIVFPLPRPYVDDVPARANNSGRPYTAQNLAPEPMRGLRRRTEPIRNLLIESGTSLGSTSRRRTTGHPAQVAPVRPQTNSASLTRPPKKARLCDDGNPELLRGSEKSKFFPSDQKKHAATSTSESYLMSDDSIEDVFRDLPDIDGWTSPKKGKQVLVFEERSEEHNLMEPKDDDDEALNMTSAREIVPSETPLKSSIGRFAFGRTSTSSSTNMSCPQLARSLSNYSTPSSIPCSTPSTLASSARTASTTQSTPATPLMTPLQRLGARALGINKQPPTPTVGIPQPAKKRGAGRRSLDDLPINPAFIPLPPVDLAELEVLQQVKGSEDMIVPDSENEDEDEETVKKQPGGSSQLDLSRFLFA